MLPTVWIQGLTYGYLSLCARTSSLRMEFADCIPVAVAVLIQNLLISYRGDSYLGEGGRINQLLHFHNQASHTLGFAVM